jgi:hypothetical protein
VHSALVQLTNVQCLLQRSGMLTISYYCTLLLLSQEAYPLDKLVKVIDETASSSASSSSSAFSNGVAHGAANGAVGHQLQRSHSASGIQLPMNEWSIDDARLWLTSVAAQHQLPPAHVDVSDSSFMTVILRIIE